MNFVKDLYVRDNDMINQILIHFIEAQGGEVVTTRYSAYVKMIVQPYLRKWFVEGRFLEALSSRAFIIAVSQLEKVYYKYFQNILEESDSAYDTAPRKFFPLSVSASKTTVSPWRTSSKFTT